MSISYGSGDFVAVMKGAVVSSYPPHEYASTDTPEEFGRFEDLTKKLVNVPKEEVDEKRRPPA